MTMIFFTLLFVLNCVAFAVYGYDKNRQEFNEKRISQGTLMALNVCGGAYGAGMAMLLFKSLCDVRRFRIAVPLSLAVWLILIVLLRIFA